jgi:ribosome biogenesis GTPase / thiamine phosphate phosphatase
LTLSNQTLASLGWSNLLNQAALELNLDNTQPVRIVAMHRDAIDVIGEEFSGRIPRAHEAGGADNQRLTVGDWLLVDKYSRRMRAMLPRKSLFKRRAAGTGVQTQMIAANVDTLLVVTSANQDFNVARLERYLALAHEAEVAPVVLITKADLCENPHDYVAKAASLMPGLMAEAIDARDPNLLNVLKPWLGAGQTLAVLGSSGVGKSTIVNTLMGGVIQETQGIREDDAKGRHTTTGRSLHQLATGAWLMDTPGMRELQIMDAAGGVGAVFADIAELEAACRFSDCTHVSEPDCAIRAALEAGTLDEARLKRYGKLLREERRNTEAVHLAHQRVKSFGKKVKASYQHKLNRTRQW